MVSEKKVSFTWAPESSVYGALAALQESMTSTQELSRLLAKLGHRAHVTSSMVIDDSAMLVARITSDHEPGAPTPTLAMPGAG